MSSTRPLYLASRSPRRRALLDQIGVRHRIVAVDLDETPHPTESPTDLVIRLALAKARAGRSAILAAPAAYGADGPEIAILAADTSVVVDSQILGKPRTRDEGLAMLACLSGRAHRVVTGIALLHDGIEQTASSDSQVLFRPITPAEATAYWATGEPCDKAGAYAIQGLGALFVTQIVGSYSGVMGLPLFETAQLLTTAGFDPLVAAGDATPCA
ncbi:nucleoside triphosphate pyrophosphatase [Thioalkalicoccus limnaeus]|uniref:dTTP/UTP pyrophosphatase n=1 Tax=Thioalkalicoccus limnaeus TaxID=120681 RepID=A0ABV4BDB3_9GAMM